VSVVTAGVTMTLCVAAAVAAAPSTTGRARSRVTTLAPHVVVTAGTQPRRRIVACCAVVGATGCLAVLGFGPALALVAAGVTTWRVVRRAQLARRASGVRAAVVELCRATAAELRAGQPAGTALTAGAHALSLATSRALAPALVAARQGAEDDVAELLIQASTAPGLAGLSRLAACWRVAASSGSALAPALDRIADGLQDEIEVQRDVAAELAGPRATVRLLAALPVVGLLLGTSVGADPLRFLFGSTGGLCCLLGAVALNLTGLAWAGRIAASVALSG
jgi:tight adherence protein B